MGIDIKEMDCDTCLKMLVILSDENKDKGHLDFAIENLEELLSYIVKGNLNIRIHRDSTEEMCLGGVIKKHLLPSVYEECRCLYNEAIPVNNYLALSTAFFLRLRLILAPASPARPIPSSAIVVGSGTACTALAMAIPCVKSARKYLNAIWPESFSP